MMAHPILINRPIVVTPKGVRLRRPSELGLNMLEKPLLADFIKEDGERILATAYLKLVACGVVIARCSTDCSDQSHRYII
jgi:arsenate reductase